MIRRTHFLPIAFLACLAGCAASPNVIYYSNVTSLKKDMTTEETLQAFRIVKQKHRGQLVVVPLDAQTVVYSYALAMGNYFSTYFLAFKDDRLLFWGYPHEFARSEDQELNRIGRDALAKLRETEK